MFDTASKQGDAWMTSSMKNKTAIVTGASRGIGEAIATRLAEEGCRLLIADINIEGARRLSEQLREQTEVYAIECDVSSTEGVENMVAETHSRLGQIDFLVNNAAMVRNNYLTKMTDADWDTVLAVNLSGPFKCIRAVAPSMIKQGSGRIVTIASGSSAGMIGQSNYASSKAGLYGLTKTAALELAKFNINVNAVSPGFVVTPMTEVLAERVHQDVETFIADAARAIPLQRPGYPRDIANAVRFLLSDESSFMTGQILNVRGGPGPASF